MSSHSAASRRPERLALPRPGRGLLRRLVIAAIVLALLAAGWTWLRESPLVAVDRVTVTGVSDAQAAPVRSALESAAQDMTTLDVDRAALLDAVARFPLVRDIEVTTDLPHGLRIRVLERTPVGAIESSAGTVVVASDGTILRGLPAGELPRISSRISPGGARVSDRRTAVKVAVLANAPRRLRSRIVRVTLGPQGLVAVLTSGPSLRFGDGSRLRAKWIAATRVLHDPIARDASYIDLRIPERPAAGGLSVEQGGTQVAPTVASGAATGSATQAAGGTTGATGAVTQPGAVTTTPATGAVTAGAAPAGSAPATTQTAPPTETAGAVAAPGG